MTLRVEITNTDPNDPEVWNKQGFVRKVLVDQVDYDPKNPQNGSPIPPFQSEILPGGTTGFYVWNGRRLLISEEEVPVTVVETITRSSASPDTIGVVLTDDKDDEDEKIEDEV